MVNWGAGYVTDVNYIPGYYVQQSPVHMVAAARLAGIACDMPDPDEPVHYLELGCGLGVVALTLAASNSAWRVTGIDFNPAHIASARALAREADVTNVTFIEADLATLAEDRIGDAIAEVDFASAHGVWSWVPPAVRSGIVRLLRGKLRAGGILHLSYNALPGWQSRLGMQRLVRAAGTICSGNSERRAVAGFEILRELHAAGARHLTGDAHIGALLDRQQTVSGAYLAHEFMNACWSPSFHADVVGALSDAKLEWVASGSLLESIPELTMTPAQREVHDRIEDPLYRELVKDLCLARSVRHDIFVRGPQRLSSADRETALSEIVLLSTVRAEELVYEIEMADGKAQLPRNVYDLVLAALAAGPRPVSELISLLEQEGRQASAAELVGILIGTRQAIPVLRPGAPQSRAAAALNRVFADTFGRIEQRGTGFALASAALGAGLAASALELFVHSRIQCGEDASALDAWTGFLGHALNEAAKEQLRDLLARIIAERLPVFRTAGVLSS